MVGAEDTVLEAMEAMEEEEEVIIIQKQIILNHQR